MTPPESSALGSKLDFCFSRRLPLWFRLARCFRSVFHLCVQTANLRLLGGEVSLGALILYIRLVETATN